MVLRIDSTEMAPCRRIVIFPKISSSDDDDDDDDDDISTLITVLSTPTWHTSAESVSLSIFRSL